MLHTTFARAKEAGACQSSYHKFAVFKGGVTKWGKEKPFPLDEVLEICGLDDALWALQIAIEPAEREIRQFACDCAERVLSIYEKENPEDKRPRLAIEVSRKYALGEATIIELETTARAVAEAIAEAVAEAIDRAAAGAAGDTAWAARDAGRAAREAAWAARNAARADEEVAWAARAAAWAARDAARAAREAAWAGRAAGDAAWAAEQDWQKYRLLALLKGGN